jgi:hypothetical protein
LLEVGETLARTIKIHGDDDFSRSI